MTQKTNYFYRLFDRRFQNPSKSVETETSLALQKNSQSNKPSSTLLSAHEKSNLDSLQTNQTKLNPPTEANLSLIIFKWTVWMGVIGLSFSNFQQNDNFNRLFELSNIALLAWSIGIIDPDLVIRFGLSKNRLTVTLLYLTIAIVYQVFSSIA